jgi:peroxiredoxin
LVVESWVLGSPVQLGNGKQTNLVVLTFFESWCDSCMTALPRLAHLQERVKAQGVRFVGVSVEPAEAIKSFAGSARIGPLLNFPLAADKENTTYNSYMIPYGRKSVPCSFVVDGQGLVVWEGPPLAGLEQALDQMLAGNYDREAANRASAAERLQADYFALVYEEAAFKSLSVDTARGTAEELGGQILKDGASNPWLLNNFAWKILTDQKIKSRDLALAVRASRAACEADKTRNPSFSDTYAKALFQSGKVSEAVDAQQHAVEKCADPAHRLRLEQTLKAYREAAVRSKP